MGLEASSRVYQAARKKRVIAEANKEEMGVARYWILIIACLTTFELKAQNNEYYEGKQYGGYNWLKEAKRDSSHVLVRGVVLNKKTLEPIIGLPQPIITCKKSKKEFPPPIITGMSLNIESGTFSLWVKPGKYRFVVSGLGYHQIETEIIRVRKHDLFVF